MPSASVKGFARLHAWFNDCCLPLLLNTFYSTCVLWIHNVNAYINKSLWTCKFWWYIKNESVLRYLQYQKFFGFSNLIFAQHPLKARPPQWRSSARFPHCRWTQPSNAVDPPARAQCSDPRNHWNHLRNRAILCSDESVVFSLGVQNITTFRRDHTLTSLAVESTVPCRIKLSFKWNQTKINEFNTYHKLW